MKQCAMIIAAIACLSHQSESIWLEVISRVTAVVLIYMALDLGNLERNLRK